jgi:hypothetical protein
MMAQKTIRSWSILLLHVQQTFYTLQAKIAEHKAEHTDFAVTTNHYCRAP